MEERALTGKQLFEASLVYGFSESEPQWDELSWDKKDEYQAQADEINEARKGTP